MTVVIRVENVSKKYELGKIGTQSFKGDFQRWWAKVRGKEDPFKKIGEQSQIDNREFWALQDINFEVKQGDAVGIIGKNGAGKSTLLKILSRITIPTTGNVKIKGRIASLLEVGTGFNPELTGRENIFLNGAILGMSKAEVRAKFDEIVDFSGIERFIDTPVKRYSSGMYVRLAFAVAAHLESEILILDEVLAVGDSEFQKKCLGKMDDVANSQGRTVLFVSHNMAAVSSLCKKAILFNSGKVIKRGETADIVAAYIDNQTKITAEKVWTDFDSAPGNDKVKIVSIRIVANGRITDSIAIDQEFSIELEFYNKRPGSYLSCGIQIIERSEVRVLASVNWPSASISPDTWANKPYPEGIFKSVCTIPANFLNEGSFYINALVLSNISNEEVKVSDAVSFEIVDVGPMRKEYVGKWIGVVRVKLKWQTQMIELAQ